MDVVVVLYFCYKSFYRHFHQSLHTNVQKCGQRIYTFPLSRQQPVVFQVQMPQGVPNCPNISQAILSFFSKPENLPRYLFSFIFHFLLADLWIVSIGLPSVPRQAYSYFFLIFLLKLDVLLLIGKNSIVILLIFFLFLL